MMLAVRRVRLQSYSFAVRTFVKVGDPVPVTFMKDEKPPTIKEDKEYPEWLNSIAEKCPTKAELLDKFNAKGASSFTHQEAKRLKRLMTLEEIKAFNLASIKSQS